MGNTLTMGNASRWAMLDDGGHLTMGNIWTMGQYLGDGQCFTMGNTWRWAILGDGQCLAMGNTWTMGNA
jgi:hypothetical protein